MNRAWWVIRVLEDSKNGRIESQNQLWLLLNVESLHIRVCVEDCVADTFDIAEDSKKEGTILIQEGKEVRFNGDFHPEKEALLLTKYRYRGNIHHLVFLYAPKK